MTAHAAIAAVPKTGQPNRTLLQALLVTRVAWIVGIGEDPTAFDPRGEDGSPLTQVIGYNGLWFWYDEADATTGHDGVTCIVTSATGGRYKVTGVDLLITHVISKTLTTPPDPDDIDPDARPDDGDAYLVPAASTGGWATKENYIAVWVAARREWFYIAPKPGWFVWVAGATVDTAYHYDSVQAAWIAGLGGGLSVADNVPLSSIIGCAASLTIRVENQTTYAPPGSRKTGATPAMPLGGTASNINDNSDTTTAVTSALGDKTGATVANRIFARLTLAAATTLICIEARGVLGSTTSSATAMGLYYSIDSGANWVQAGAGFTLSATAQDIQRTGSFVAVTDIAVVTEAKNWSTNTHTIAGLNAFDATVTAAIGDAYIVPSNGIGIFAGLTGKVMICEIVNTFTTYTPGIGDKVYDLALANDYRWNGSTWEKTSGNFKIVRHIYTAGANFTKDARCFAVNIKALGAGGSGSSGSATTNPTHTTFGSYVTANSGISGTAGGAGGTGSAAELHINGESASAGPTAGNSQGPFGSIARPIEHYGKGGVGTSNAGGGGEYIEQWLEASSITSIVALTIGTNSGNGVPGTNGWMLIEEYINT